MSDRALRAAARHARKMLARDRRIVSDSHVEPDGKVRDENASQWLAEYDRAIAKLDKALALKPAGARP